MKVLVSDNLGEAGIKMFQQTEGIEVDVNTGLCPDELKRIIGQYDGLVIRSATKVTEDILEAATKLRVVGRAGIGLDNVNIAAATKRGVVVMNTPTGNVVTTAEHAVAMMLSLTRNIPRGTVTLKEGHWEKKNLQGREIYQKTLGIIGYGKIGTIVADRALGLKMRVVIYDPYVTPEKILNDGYESIDLQDLYKQSDYISVHVPKMKSTLGLINKAAFDQMKEGVMLINCARGGIVDENDLYNAIVSGKVAGAAIDVFETEPPPQDHPLLTLDRVICTPHLGASTHEAQTNVAVMVANQIIEYLINGTIVNAVNVPSITGELLDKMGPYLNLAEKMGWLHHKLIQGAPQKVCIEYKGDFKGMDLTAITTALLKGLLAPMVNEVVNFVNAGVLAQERGIEVTEITRSKHSRYGRLITIRVTAAQKENVVAGTIFGKQDVRILRINDFYLEIVPEGNMALIYNLDVPGSIGEIGTVLGHNKINIGQMQVGQKAGRETSVIFLTTDTPIPDHVVKSLRELQTVKSVMRLEF